MPNQNQDVPGMLNMSHETFASLRSDAMPTIKALIDGMTHPAGSPRGVRPDDNDAHLENGKARA